MLFNSFEFLIFLPVVVLVYYIIPNNNLKRIFLILASIFFIVSANIFSLLIISLIAVFNYFIGIEIARQKDLKVKKGLFLLAVLINVGNLFFFKYYDFFNENLTDCLRFNEPEKSIALCSYFSSTGNFILYFFSSWIHY